MKLIMFIESDYEIVMPRSYNHLIQEWLYSHISDLAFRIFLLNQGYDYENQQFRLFTFSRLQGKWHLDRTKKNMVFASPLVLQIASPLMVLMNEVAGSFLLGKKSQLGSNTVKVVAIKVVYDEISESSHSYQIQALSPIVAYKTITKNDRKSPFYFHPGEAEFVELIKENLKKKSEILQAYGLTDYGPLKGDFKIYPNYDPTEIGSTALYYNGFFVKGYIGEFCIKCGKPWLKVALDTGLGGKNAQGFGMVEIKKE